MKTATSNHEFVRQLLEHQIEKEMDWLLETAEEGEEAYAITEALYERGKYNEAAQFVAGLFPTADLVDLLLAMDWLMTERA